MLWAVLAFAVVVIAVGRRWPKRLPAPSRALVQDAAPVDAEFLPARLSPPLGHEADRQPVPLSELVHRLRDADLGEVSAQGATVLVSKGAAGVRLTPADPSRVVRSSLAVTATRLELLALTLDALAPLVGAVECTWNGMTLKLDGTMPRSAVERAVHLALEDHRRALERSLRTAPKRPDDELLH